MPDPREKLGKPVKDKSTGIAGLVNAVCFNEREDTQFRIKRYGVDNNGLPLAMHWAYVSDCEDVSEHDARER